MIGRGCGDCDWWRLLTSLLSSDFGLVCGRDYLTSLAQTLFFVGMVLGVFTFGVLSDMYAG